MTICFTISFLFQICTDLINSYECHCPLGYVGDDCSIDIDPCAKDPCANGSCIVDKTSNDWACKCKPGFTGMCNYTRFIRESNTKWLNEIYIFRTSL